MKKIFGIVLIIVSMIVVSSCGTVKYTGNGKGFSANEQIASDIADLNAAIDASKQNNWTVEEHSVIETVDSNGSPKTVYTSTREGTTVTTFTNNSFKRDVKKKGKTYRATSKFNGNTDNE